jgi:cephalosporin hydroxylase
MRKLKNKTLVEIEETGICGDLDKGSNCTNPIQPAHTYLEVYDILFAPYKESNTSIMEIGIQYGCSLRLWKEYFTEDSSVFGIDICDNCSIEKVYKNLRENAFPNPMEVDLDEDFTNIHLDKVDSHNPQQYLNKLYLNQTKFDIIIDDGWHSPTSNVVNFMNFIPYLKKDGLYVVEDMNIDGHFDEVVNALDLLGYELHIIDMRHTERPDNVLGIYYHRDGMHSQIFESFLSSKVWEKESQFSVDYSIKKQQELIRKGVRGWNPHTHPNNVGGSIYPETTNDRRFITQRL